MKPVEDVVKIGNLNMDDVGEDGCPNGFSLLEPTKKYSLVGGAYILNGKVRQNIMLAIVFNYYIMHE